MEDEHEEDLSFGDKFTRWLVGAIPGFLVTMLFEYLYNRWVIEQKKDRGEESTEN
jgi:hypothetical protein